jgi:hypothetical protein
MGDADKLAILNRTGPGSTPQEPLALVAMMSNSERRTLESGGRGGLASAAESNTTSLEIRYRTSIQHSPTFLLVTSRLLGEVYYFLYGDNCAMRSNVAIDPEEPFLGRIRADFVAPPHSPITIKQCISREERTPFIRADLFADVSCDTPLNLYDHIQILLADAPGLSPNNPMAIVVQVGSPIPDGEYVIKNRAEDIYWTAHCDRIRTLFWTTQAQAKVSRHAQVSERSPILQILKD